jgi:hypothetical protein
LGNDEYVSGPDGGSDMIYAYHKTYWYLYIKYI